MSEKQSIRDELATLLNDTDPEGGVDPDDEFADQQFWYPQVDAILASPVIRRIQAEALREARADLRAYTDSGAPFGHRPVEDFLEKRAERIEKGEP